MLSENIRSAENSELRAYRARWIIPISRPAIEDGIVAVRDGEIVFAGERRGWHDSFLDLGDVAILPGLVNAHTHLEFSDVVEPFGFAAIRLPSGSHRLLPTAARERKPPRQQIWNSDCVSRLRTALRCWGRSPRPPIGRKVLQPRKQLVSSFMNFWAGIGSESLSC